MQFYVVHSLFLPDRQGTLYSFLLLTSYNRLLNAAARLVIATRKFDHGLSRLLHDELHWLDIPKRVHYKLGVTVHRCLHDKTPSTWSIAVHQSRHCQQTTFYFFFLFI